MMHIQFAYMCVYMCKCAVITLTLHGEWCCCHDLQGKDGSFMLLKSLTSHTEWEIFPKVKCGGG